jgi:hypothetical protein
MLRSRRGRIIELLDEKRTDEKIIQTLDIEFPPGTFLTSNRKALSGTKWDLRNPK